MRRIVFASPAQAAPSFDYSEWLGIYEAYTGNNSEQNWDDLSGNGRHLGPNVASNPFLQMTSAATNTTAFTTVGSPDEQRCSWINTGIYSNTPADYTQVTTFMRSNAGGGRNDGRLAMLRQASAPNRYTWAAINSGYAIAQDDVPAGDNIVVPANQVVLMVVEFRASTGTTITLNGQVVASGIPYYQVPVTMLSVYNQSQGFVVRGEHYGYALGLGINSARTQRLVSKWKADLNLSF